MSLSDHSAQAKSRFKGATIFVTGGAGFIGSAVVRHLLDDTSAFVVNIDKLTYAANLASIPQADGHPHYVLEKIDICDSSALRRVFLKYAPQAVIHLAAESHVDRSIDHPAQFIRTNVVGTFTLLQEASWYWRKLDAAGQKAFRLLHISTNAVFEAFADEEPRSSAAFPDFRHSPAASTVTFGRAS